MMLQKQATAVKPEVHKGMVHCPMCTHTVDADVVHLGRRNFVKPGQKCRRCSSTLDAAAILSFPQAA